MAVLRRPRDFWSSVTHLAGCAASLVVTAWLVWAARGGLWWPFLVFGLSLSALYAASGTYHAVRVPPRALEWFRKLDHSSIFVLIAGTYTPVLMLGLSGSWRVVCLAVIWGIAVLGVGLKMVSVRQSRWVTALLYVVMGWLSLVVVGQLAARLPGSALVSLVLGGVFYTLGAVVYATRKFNPWPGVFGFHEVWHLFVLAGSAAHVVMMGLILPLAG
ncbi:MAG TPA: hemolysin III family protein [Deinococcales bacterium]|nr:hemolysin III family protein [Deinococcales bacterium]